MSFGTGGIRGFLANDKESIIKLKEEGLDARILKGPNTLNNIVLLITSAGVAKFGLKSGISNRWLSEHIFNESTIQRKIWLNLNRDHKHISNI